MSTFYITPRDPDLMHYGVKGMKWGVRKDSGRKQFDKRKAVKIAVAAAAVVGVGVAAYYLNRYGAMNFDKVIKRGSSIQHMSRYTGELLDKPFYASYKSRDNKIYTSSDFYGSNWNTKMTLRTSKDLRIAGKKNSERIYSQWLNGNPEAKKRFGNQSYYSFNRNLNSPDYRDRKLFDSFYGELKRNGYDAIRDVNDQTQSGAISPLIIFGSLGDIKVSDIRPVR